MIELLSIWWYKDTGHVSHFLFRRLRRQFLSQPLPVRVSITAQFRASFPLDVHWSPNLARVPSPSTTDHNCIYEPHHALARLTKEPIRKQTANFFLFPDPNGSNPVRFLPGFRRHTRSVRMAFRPGLPSPLVSDGLPSCSCAVMDGWLHLSTP